MLQPRVQRADVVLPFAQGTSKHSSVPVRKLRGLPNSVPKDKDRLLPLIQETVEEGGSVLVFCGGRAQTQSTAGMTADNLALKEALPACLSFMFHSTAQVFRVS